MARKECRAAATMEQLLTALCSQCAGCGQPMWVAYHTQRTITTLQGSCRLTLCVRRCRNQQCPRYHCPYRPEEEGRWALPHGEFGLDVIALVGTLRYTSHRSIPEIHQALCDRGVPIAERTVTHLLQRYEELVALSLSGQQRLRDRFKEQGQIMLAIDGLQPDVGHEVLWVLRDCLSGEVLLARSLLSACEADLASLLREAQQELDVPIRGVISDGQHSIRKAVQTVLPDVPHQLCHFHYLREQAGYDQLEALLATLSEEQMTIPGVNGSWSVKDNLAHLTVWQSYQAARQEGTLNGAEPPNLAPGLETEDEINEYFYQQQKDRPLAEVLADFRVSYQRVLAATQALSWEALNEPFPWDDNNVPVGAYTMGNTYGHYKVHREIIQRWLESQK